MFDALRRYRERRVLADVGTPRRRCGATRCAALPFLASYDAERASRGLRDLVVLFLDAKSIVGARGHDVTPLQRAIIAIQACVLVLNLDLALLRRFRERRRVSRRIRARTGNTRTRPASCTGRTTRSPARRCTRGPVVLSWPDVAASADWDASQMNLVIHEFAHKIDMHDGDANGCPPLPDDAARRDWQRVMRDAYDDFCARVDAARGDGDRSVRGGESGRVLRRAVGSLLRRAAAAARRLSGRLSRIRAVLSAGPRAPRVG